MLSQIDAAPAHNLVDLRVRPVHHKRQQLRHLRFIQQWRRANTNPGDQPGQTLRVVAMHPVAQRLPVHTVHLRRLGPRMALQYHRKRQKPAHMHFLLVSVTEHTREIALLPAL